MCKILLNMANNEIFPYKVDNLPKHEGIEYIQCRNAALVHVCNLDDHINREFKHPAKLNAFIVLICTRGEVNLSVLMKDYTLSENTMLVAPASVVTFKDCKDCELYIMAFGSEFAADMNIDLKVVMPIVASLYSQCIVRELGHRFTAEILRKTFAEMYRESARVDKESGGAYFREMSTRHMYASVIYRLCEYVAQKNQVVTEAISKDRSSDYFKQLVSLFLKSQVKIPKWF